MLSEPIVLPWNALTATMNPFLCVYILASLMAPSTASVPLAQKKLYLMSPGVMSAMSRASTPRSGSISSWLGIGVRSVSWFLTASTISGLAQPCVSSPYPPRQSMYSRPRTSWKTAPEPVHSVAAQSPASVTDLRYSSQPPLKCSAKLRWLSVMISFASDSASVG